MVHRLARRAVVLLVVAMVPSLLWAHKPSYSGGEFSAQQKAYLIKDVDLSIVLYHKAECQSLALWLKFDVKQSRELFVQLGIPKIIRLLKYRPLLAVVAKGLEKPKQALPFELPEGYGAVVFATNDVERPKRFFEPFTNTDSLVLVEKKVKLPQAGEGYVVAWHPKQTGKYWVAVGEREDFGPDDFKSFTDWFDKTQAYHEVGDYETNNPPKEKICEWANPKPKPPGPSSKQVVPPVDTKQPTNTGDARAPSGLSCNTSSQPSDFTLFLVLSTFLLFYSRRR